MVLETASCIHAYSVFGVAGTFIDSRLSIFLILVASCLNNYFVVNIRVFVNLLITMELVSIVLSN